MKYRYLFAALLPVIALLGVYWLKCCININFSEKYSLSKYVPFKYLKRNDVIARTEPGLLLHDSFNTNSLVEKWSRLWMREDGRVIKRFESGGINNSRCLVITSESAQSWSLSHNKYVAVRQNDVFHYGVQVRLQGKNITASAGVAAFDENKKALSWNYTSKKMTTAGRWIKIAQRFTVTDPVRYISFRLSGTGAGEYRFDDVTFRKLPSAP